MEIGYDTISTSLIIAVFAMMVSVLIFAFCLRQLIQIYDDPSILENYYATVKGDDKYDHLRFDSWKRKYLFKRAIAILIFVGAFAGAYLACLK